MNEEPDAEVNVDVFSHHNKNKNMDEEQRKAGLEVVRMLSEDHSINIEETVVNFNTVFGLLTKGQGLTFGDALTVLEDFLKQNGSTSWQRSLKNLRKLFCDSNHV